MAWTHDKRCLDLESELFGKFGDSAFVVAVSRLASALELIERRERQLEIANDKLQHGCGFGECPDCGG